MIGHRRQGTVIGIVALATLGTLSLTVASPREPSPAKAGRQDLLEIPGVPRAALKVAGLRNPARVYADRRGIPHIYATSIEDAYFALGYLHASHRLLQMELGRRRAAGTMAELYGPDRLEEDMFIRRVGIHRTVEAAWRSPEIYTKIKIEIVAYCAGVNAYLREMDPATLPDPLRSLGSGLRPWTPVDSLSLLKFMAWQQAGAGGDLRTILRLENSGAQIVEKPHGISAPAGSASAKPAARIPLMPQGLSEAAGTILNLLRKSGADEAALGGDGWVVSGRKSATGKPMLAHDLQGESNRPCPYYIAHVSTPSLNVVGLTLPGFPYVLAGRNNRVAWGSTPLKVDVVDYFIEKTDPSRPHQYSYEGTWREMSRRVERFEVRGENPVEVEIESTLHGPVISAGSNVLTLAWTGTKPTFEANFFQGRNNAGNLEAFKITLSHLTVPAMNVLYADIDGNIALASRGAIPVRKSGGGSWPADGASGEYDWTGIVPEEQLPLTLDPGENFLATVDGIPLPGGAPQSQDGKSSPSGRARHLLDLLGRREPLTLGQLQEFQLDVQDPAATWRMVIDLGNPERSFAILAGGQSENPTSPHYDDQMKLWLDSQYLPLYFCPAPGELPPAQVESQLSLEPEE
jgi:penicillin amidase